MIEDRVGKNQGVYITKPLDTWHHEVRGSSARVFLCNLKNNQYLYKPAAIKIMRPDKEDYALPLFIEEVKILKALDDVPGITQMLEMGYIAPDSDYQFPYDTTSGGCENLQGRIVRYEANEDISYKQIEDWISLGWTPYIALKLRNYKNNLLMLCDRAYTPNHEPFDLEKAIDVSIQICDIFSEAHSRNIVYLDHKILHFYWHENLSKAYVIDWNVGRKRDSSLSYVEKKFDVAQFGARALHFIFTGRIAGAALPLGPTRPDEIQSVFTGYKANWIKPEDEHIPESLKELISAIVNGEYFDFNKLRSDLKSFKKDTK